jgi:hypothetical protein
MSDLESKSFIGEIFNQIKGFIIPVIVSLITAPILTISAYKGLIQKEPKIDKLQNLIYPLYCTQDSITSLNFKFILYDTENFAFGNERFILMPVPENITYVNSTHRSLSGLQENTIGVKISRISKGEYKLHIPLVLKVKKEFIDGKNGALRISQGTADFANIRSYQFTDWFFFNPWKTAGLILLTMLLIKLIISKFKKNEKK